MTRFSNPLAPSQVPNTQGRPAASSQHQRRSSTRTRSRPAAAFAARRHPRPSIRWRAGSHRGQRPATRGYPEAGVWRAAAGPAASRRLCAPARTDTAMRSQLSSSRRPIHSASQAIPRPRRHPLSVPVHRRRQQHAPAPPLRPSYDGYAGDPFAGSYRRGRHGQPGSGYGQPAAASAIAARPRKSPGFGRGVQRLCAPGGTGYGQGYPAGAGTAAEPVGRPAGLQPRSERLQSQLCGAGPTTRRANSEWPGLR